MAYVRRQDPAPDGMPERLSRFVLEDWLDPEQLAGPNPPRVAEYGAKSAYLRARQRWFEDQGYTNHVAHCRANDDDSWRGWQT